MRKFITAGVAGLAVIALAGCNAQGGGGAADPAASDDAAQAPTAVQIIVPADTGGGWDQTGREASNVLLSEKLVNTAKVENVGGSGGTVGLAALANEKDPNTLMVTGLVMVGAVETNASEVRIEDTTPIARLTDEPLVIVVPKSSPYQDVDDLVEAVKAEGKNIAITGGSAGGADHILAGLLLQDAGLDSAGIQDSLNYVPNAGGGEAVSLLLGNKVDAGISGVGEFSEYVDSGEMRALAVSSDVPAALLPEAPTLTDEGYDVVYTNWRGLLAPGDITDAQADALVALVTAMHETTAWTSTLETKGWSDAFLTGPEFDTFLTENIGDVQTTLKAIGLTQ